MEKQDAQAIAKALQENMGNDRISYIAIPSHKYQTWVIMMSYTNGEYHKETLFPTKDNLIHFLIGYARNK